MTEKLRVFVASSSEQLGVAAEIAQSINRSKAFHAQPWDKEVFEFSKTYIESLEQELDRADFAIVVLTADDAGNVRGRKVSLPRDNVIFELGLFAGCRGRSPRGRYARRGSRCGGSRPGSRAIGGSGSAAARTTGPP